MTSDEIKRIIGTAQRKDELPPNFFERILEPYLRSFFVRSQLITVKMKDLVEVSRQKAAAKDEPEYANDSNKLSERFLVGDIAERAIEIKFNLPPGSIVDPRVKKNRDMNYPDLSPLGYKMGSKASQVHNVPMISPRIEYPNIISLVNLIGGSALVAVLGVAEPCTVAEYGSPALLIDAEYRDKVGFYGLDRLGPLPEIK